MDALAFLMVGFAPGLFWMWRVYRRNRNRPDPKGLVLRTFLLGVGVALPIVIVELLVAGPNGMQLSEHGMAPAAAAFNAFLVAGVVEEVGKYLVVRSTMWDSPYLDEPLRGMVYSSAAALGFSSIENVKYMIAFGPAVIVMRGLFSTLGHLFFSGTWGYALGAARQQQPAGSERGTATLLVGLGAAILLHGGFDYFLFLNQEDSFVLAFGVFALSGILFAALFSLASRRSPHRGKVSTALRACPRCGKQAPASNRFCDQCGTDVAAVRVELRCGGCGGTLAAEAVYCQSCGHRAERRATG